MFTGSGALVAPASDSEIRDLTIRIVVRIDDASSVSLRNVRIETTFVGLEVLSASEVRLECVHCTASHGLRVCG